MNPKEKMLMLQNEGFPEITARAFVEDDLKCVYCGEDLLDSRRAYSSSGIDHIFPKSKYPGFENDPKNIVTCCSSCNTIKSGFDPIILFDWENTSPAEILDNRRP